MKTYYIKATGYTVDKEQGFTLAEARKALSEILKYEKVVAKERWKRPAVIRHSKNHAAIHAMKHVESPLWAEFFIVAK